MKLSELKTHLNNVNQVNFVQPNGTFVPESFHVTEVGMVSKDFIDCGGTVRHEKVANFQLWNANDTDHRLKPQKLLKIIALSEKTLGIEDLDIEVEYQTETIGKYNLEFNGKDFELTAKQTACLAMESCGIPTPKQKLQHNILQIADKTCCAPGGGCC